MKPRIETVPHSRILSKNQAPLQPHGRFVLYWMRDNRRLTWNFALQRALDWAVELGRPLLIVETLSIDPWSNDRLHRFALEGMMAHQSRLAGSRISYYPFVESGPGDALDLLTALSQFACLIVGDEFPRPSRWRRDDPGIRGLPIRFERVDSNGLLPLTLAPKTFSSAFSFRAFLQKELPRHLGSLPEPDPIAGRTLARPPQIPLSILDRWPLEEPARLRERPQDLPIDHTVTPVPAQGGTEPASRVLKRFLESDLGDYPDFSGWPHREVTSRLSPYLHFGHISAHQVFHDLMHRLEWSPFQLSSQARGCRQGWWKVSEGAERFLDQLITWRELGYNMSHRCPEHDEYRSLPDWARTTLEEHAGDEREFLYTFEEFQNGATHDSLWNAAQTQLVREGKLPNYLRMLWGKKILEWSPSPEEALETMIQLNNTYALDGRNPNSYSGIFWILGRYDRAWGPERPVFGKVRYMSSRNAPRKFPVRAYLEEYAA